MRHRLLGLLAFVLLTRVPAGAQVILLDFEGLDNAEPVLSFYDGGLGGFGSGPGPDHDITFSATSLALIDADAGGAGNFGGEPSPDTVMFFLAGSAVMNVPNGFDNGFSFFYAAPNFPGMITVYDGLNATGNVLATLNLPLTPFNGAPDPTGTFSPFVPIGVPFNGIARSVSFSGTANQVIYDNITLGRPTPIGAPSVGAPVMPFAGYLILLAGLFWLGITRTFGREDRRLSS